MNMFVKSSGVVALGAMIVAGGMFVTTPASAENINDVCVTALTAEGVKDLSGCKCMQDLVKDNAALEAHLITLGPKGPGIAPRRKAANDEGKAALDKCFPAPKKE